ncbi:golgin subfamily A member 6-like protein 24 isoform X1 [Amphiprion ocellaris]|uniref:Platelet-derived growth factor subunit B n=1 Tax=Amphiprion ocellaris TaxID=80972 RepID=A0A3Q1BZP4_AMPOC|nr:golgin subfamily A member 6-like protein 24 isoform X1 [Amphiprion ocellaris]XP_023133931.2 golgin subfamily A member 6-like protein 24 isoform X1 [Amphiprion ocellaris]XP_054861467.1 golgin subfamily A member 6-like protein 24 isoform X1 [Amphiprion ocellaris]XP_054861468.1 golgin subfamily A member 6-like protein 24 isoform X1 [Amphiprion ocellaris]
MSSWVQLLLALLAACLRFSIAEGDALPAALVELVRKSTISSTEDLQLLLLTDSIDEEDGTSAANGGHRLPRSLDAQPAQQALCKVRTEVVEVTRAMLDRSNANFLLWPPCVEVQRCSGCCNTKSLQCLPIVTHTRYLQVMKIEYINKRPTYAKAVVSFVDHVECRCQPTPHSPGPKTKSSRKQHIRLHRNETLSQDQAQGQVKVHSKDELHQWDELKQNQRAHLDDLLQQQWRPRGDTFSQPGEGYSLAGEDTSWSGEAIFFAPHWPHKSTRLVDTKNQSEKQENVERNHGRVSDGRKTNNIGIQVKETLIEDGEGLSHNNTEMKVNEYTQTHYPLWPESKSNFSKSHTSSHFQHDTQNPQAKLNPTEETTTKRLRSRFRTTKEPNPDLSEQVRWRKNKTPEERIAQTEETTLEERKELLLFYQRMDQEEILKQQQIRREEENRLKEEETNSQQRLHDKHLQTTTQTPETTTSTATTQQPSAAEASKLLPRSDQTRRRMRKNRKRISKAAMRAMLM